MVAVRSAHIEPPRGTALDSGPECRRLRQVNCGRELLRWNVATSTWFHWIKRQATNNRAPDRSLIVSPSKFNRLTGVPIVLPITRGGDFAHTKGFAVSVPEHIMEEVLARLSPLLA